MSRPFFLVGLLILLASCSGKPEAERREIDGAFWAPAALRALDHSTLVDETGSLHCFFTDGDWLDGDGRSFGHIESPDLENWERHENVVLSAGNYTLDHVWAPHVIRERGRWRMYFTGVELGAQPRDNVQRIFMSESVDLKSWTTARMVLEPSLEGVAWGTDLPWGNDARDPMVYRVGEDWEMLLTIRLSTGQQTLGVAHRTGEYEWQLDHWLKEFNAEVAESAFRFKLAGSQWIAVSNWNDGGQQFWELSGARWVRRPVSTEGFAAELTAASPGGLLLSSSWQRGIFFRQVTDLWKPAVPIQVPLIPGDNVVQIY